MNHVLETLRKAVLAVVAIATPVLCIGGLLGWYIAHTMAQHLIAVGAIALGFAGVGIILLLEDPPQQTSEDVSAVESPKDRHAN